MGKIKKYLVLDCETCTVQERGDYDFTEDEKNTIGIALPVIYDLAWLVVDRNGNIYDKQSILIQETFFNEDMFSTGYYANKRKIYLEGLKKGKFSVMKYQQALKLLEKSANKVDFVCAYNCNFDFKKAIPFTRRYLNGVYTQERLCRLMRDIADKKKNDSKREDWLVPSTVIYKNEYPLFDIWQLAVDTICNTKGYKRFCQKHDFCTASGKFYKTSAETVYAYITKNPEYEECHTALEDCYIESAILQKALKKKAIKNPLEDIEAFVFRKLGRYDEGE